MRIIHFGMIESQQPGITLDHPGSRWHRRIKGHMDNGATLHQLTIIRIKHPHSDRPRPLDKLVFGEYQQWMTRNAQPESCRDVL
jgi:hypothetical protein